MLPGHINAGEERGTDKACATLPLMWANNVFQSNITNSEP
jgi:hypothetical protein